MGPQDHSRLRRTCRTASRALCLATLLLLLAFSAALAYLNYFGLPGFVKKPLLQKLHERGIDLSFDRLRWILHRGFVAENVSFGATNSPGAVSLAAREATLSLDLAALTRLNLQVHALRLRQGRCAIPITGTNSRGRSVLLDNIETELLLLPNDLWRLSHFQARFANGFIQLEGTLTNASAIRNWTLFQTRPGPPGEFQNQLRRYADVVDQIQFIVPPQLKLNLYGDARHPHSFVLKATVSAPNSKSPWGNLQQGFLSIQVSPTNTPGPHQSCAQIRLRAASAQTPWIIATNFQLVLALLAGSPASNKVQSNIELAAARIDTQWGHANHAKFTAQCVNSITNPIPISGKAKLTVADPQTQWGNARRTEFDTSFSHTPPLSPPPDSSWAGWSNLAPYALSWECRVLDLQSPKLKAQDILCVGYWRPPELRATRIAASLYGGSLNARADLDIPTRRLGFSGSSTFDVQQISALLTPKSRDWLAQYSWQIPPRLQADGALILPDWTNRHPIWQRDIKPTITLAGQFQIQNGAFRGAPASTASGHFTYSNQIWLLPDLVVTRPEGRLELLHESNERTRDYYFRIHSTLDMRPLRHLLDPQQQRALDLLELTQPPLVNGEIWGRWYQHDLIGARGTLALTNFTFRGQHAGEFHADLDYTNKLLRLNTPRLQRANGTEQLAATSLDVDFNADKIYVTNGLSTADPLAVARAIGPRIGKTFEPYHFPTPPTAHVEGIIPIHNEFLADLHFNVDGAPFQWWKIKVPRITGKIDWVQQRLTLRDVRASFYGGTGSGKAEFLFQTNHSATLQFEARINDADLHQLMSDLSPHSNRLEGNLTARFAITGGHAPNPASWQGAGRVTLTDGLIWEIPIFGILSPVLDSIIPGLGSSRASEGSATFGLTNGVIHSDDLSIRASMMRLKYWGDIDLQAHVNAHAEAELLRDTWVVGPVLSLALWPVSKLFEYQITGTLQQPKSEPIYLIPKLVLLPLHPIRTLKDLVPSPSSPSSSSSSPPSFPKTLDN